MQRARKLRSWREEFRAISRGTAAPSRQPTASFGGPINPSVADVQSKLNALGASPKLVVDANAGPATQLAIINFQKSKGLSPDGIAGPQTLAALGFPGATSMGPSASNPPPSNPNQTVLPPKSTTLTADEAAKALNAGYKKVTGKIPTPDVLALLMGQTALETASWQKMPNYNFGGMKAQASDAYVQVFKTTEVIGGVTQVLDQKFAAFMSAADGAAAYVKVLLSRQNWANGLHTGTPEGFVAGLASAPAYFTADPSQYLAGLKSRVTAYVALAKKYAVPIGMGIGGIATLVALGFGGLALWERYHST